MRITSSRNPAVRYARSLERASVRRQEDAYLAEGVRLVSEAVERDQHALLVLYSPDLLLRTEAGSSLHDRIQGWADQTVVVDERVLAAAALTESPSGVVAVLRMPEVTSLDERAGDRFGVILDRLADPGNAGTILRSAAAFGVSWLATTPQSVDLFSPKVVRAGMGAHFALALYPHVEWPRMVSDLHGVALVGTDAAGGEALPDFHWPEHTALVIGSEARGLSPQADAAVTRRVHVPTSGAVESLNASVAASIIFYAALGADLAGSERYR